MSQIERWGYGSHAGGGPWTLTRTAWRGKEKRQWDRGELGDLLMPLSGLDLVRSLKPSVSTTPRLLPSLWPSPQLSLSPSVSVCSPPRLSLLLVVSLSITHTHIISGVPNLWDLMPDDLRRR